MKIRLNKNTIITNKSLKVLQETPNEQLFQCLKLIPFKQPTINFEFCNQQSSNNVTND